MTDPHPERRYFTVIDEEGRVAPAVEYWAAMLTDDWHLYEGMTLRRFVKLIGSGEALKETDAGVFVGTETHRTYFQFPVTLETESFG